MQGSRIEQSRRGTAETAGFVELIQADRPVFARFLLLFEKQTHRDAHPEKLWRLQTARAFARFVDDQIAIVERLNAEEVELEVGGRIDGRGNLREIILLQAQCEPLDGNAVIDVFRES